jgi:hypothetical protein
MDRSVSTFLPLLLLLSSCLREQTFNPQQLRDRQRHAEAVHKREKAERAEETIRGRCQSNETVITLRRTPGYTSAGFSVSYDLAICGDGTVTYQGEGCVSKEGSDRARIDPADVQRLVQAFLEADYFRMTDHPPGIDAGAAYTSLSLGHRHKMVMHQEGDTSEKLTRLEDMIDKVAGSNRWINIDAAGVNNKIRQGWHIRSPDADLLLLRAAAIGDADTVRAFIQHGANVNAKVDLEARTWCRSARRVIESRPFVMPLQQARGAEVVRLLIDAGANVNPKTVFYGISPLQLQIMLGDGDSVKALVEAGANMEAAFVNSPTALMYAVGQPGGPNPGVVDALLRGGVKVNAKDRLGRTALDMLPHSPLQVGAMPVEFDDLERQRFTEETERLRQSEREVRSLLLSAGAVSGLPALVIRTIDHPDNPSNPKP